MPIQPWVKKVSSKAIEIVGQRHVWQVQKFCRTHHFSKIIEPHDDDPLRLLYLQQADFEFENTRYEPFSGHVSIGKLFRPAQCPNSQPPEGEQRLTESCQDFLRRLSRELCIFCNHGGRPGATEEAGRDRAYRSVLTPSPSQLVSGLTLSCDLTRVCAESSEACNLRSRHPIEHHE